MAKMLDIECNVEFPNDALYLAHKKAGHKGGLEKAVKLEDPPVPTPPPGVSEGDMPSQEFIEAVARIESPKPATEHSSASQHPSELPKAQPIVLTYKWLGECPEHRTPIDTLELDVSQSHFCIAYCPSGKHQVETKEVTKL